MTVEACKLYFLILALDALKENFYANIWKPNLVLGLKYYILMQKQVIVSQRINYDSLLF